MSNIAVIEQEIYSLRPLFESICIDKTMSFEREAGFAVQIIAGNSFLLKVACENIQSVIDAVTNVAAIGISLNPAKKQGYLVPRKGKVCLDISYMGLIDMAMATGSIRWAQAGLVHQGDVFVLNGYDRAPTHQYDPFSTERTQLIGAYVVVKTSEGDYLTHCMSINDVFAIRNRSEAFKSGKVCPWQTDEGEMVKKTCVKQAYKYWPKTERLQNAIQYLNTDGDEGVNLSALPEVAAPQDKPRRASEVAKEAQQAQQAPVDQAQPAQAHSDATDVTPKAKEPASDGEKLHIIKMAKAKGINLADYLKSLESALNPETLEGMTKRQYKVLKESM